MASEARPALLQLPDDAERRRAVEARESVLVRAPAGSGKTELLAQRFLYCLARVEQPESLLAITFSRKAAEEMRSRVLKAMAGEGKVAYTRALGAAAAARAEERQWNLTASPSRLRIMTFDALARGLAARMPWRSRLGGVPQPAENAGALYREAALATLRQFESSYTLPTPAPAPVTAGPNPVAAAAEALLRLLHGNQPQAVKLLAGMLERRDQWMPLVEAVWRRPESSGRALPPSPAQPSGDRGEPSPPESAVPRSRPLRENDIADVLRGELAAAVQDRLAQIRITLQGWLREDPGHLAAWKALADAMLTKQGVPRKKAERPPPSPAECAALFSVRRLPDAISNAELGALVHWLALLAHGLGELRAVFGREGRCDFTEITLAAVAALGPGELPSELAFALDGKLQHLFVDEFQDTSQSQFELLECLIREWQLGDGRTLFLVGDPMQSIYGWRNAQVSHFLRAFERRQIGSLPLECIALSANLRSHPELVTWCNQVFGHPEVAPRHANLAIGAAPFSPAVSPLPAGMAAVPSLHVWEGAGNEPEARLITAAIAAELQENPSASIAILARDRGHLANILPALTAAGITYTGVGLFALGDSPVVNDLLALTRALASPLDRVAWLALLRAPWCGLTLADLHALCHDADHPVPELLANAQTVALLSPEGQQRLAPVAAILQAALRQSGRVPMRDLVAWCWRALGGEQLTPPELRADAGVYLDELQRLSPADWADPAGLPAALGKLHAAGDTEVRSGVVVMTMHQAKGLEFDVVLLPGLTRTPPPSRHPLLIALEYPVEPKAAVPLSNRDATRVLLAANTRSDEEDSTFAWVQSLEGERRRQEQLRLLYVACTRARRGLHLFVKPERDSHTHAIKPARSLSYLAPLWPALRDDVTRLAAAGQAAELTAPLPPPSPTPPPGPSRHWLRRAPRDWSPPGPQAAVPLAPAASMLPPAARPSPWHAGSVQRQIGTAVHAMLRTLAAAGDPQAAVPLGLVRRELRAAGVAPRDLANALERATAALNRITADPRGRWILASHPESRNEWEVAGYIAGEPVHRIMDRSFVDAGVRWVIDYKTGEPGSEGLAAFLAVQTERHRPQLQVYTALVQALYPAEVVRCGLYFPMLTQWLEI